MIDILMPRLSDTMTEGAIATWLKKPGDTVAPGDLLVEIETDKALMEQEAYDAGVLVEILVAEGENVPIGTPIARLDDGSGETAGATPVADAAAPAPTASVAPAPTAEPAPTASPAPTAPPAPAAPSAPSVAADVPAAPAVAPTAEPGGARRAATPLVRRLARERGVDLADVVGSGPGGRIVRADLEDVPSSEPEAAPAPPASVPAALIGGGAGSDARDSEAVPFDAIRQQIAARLTASATSVPSFTATAAADVGALLALRAEINASSDGARVSVNDLLVRAVALALRAHPDVNASYSAEGRGATVRHGRVHVGIAVASPAGLVVPVVRDADRAAASAIARATRELVAKAAERRLTAEDMADGTFTVSNLGMYGVEHFTAIINPPQGAILAVGGVRDELALSAEGAVEVRRMLRLTLTADHRIIDGALAAQFLATLTGLLEHPLRVVA